MITYVDNKEKLMVISDAYSQPILIDDVEIPLVIDYFWTLDLARKDFKLSKLKTLEEIHTPTLAVSISGYVIDLPTSWNILIYSEETNQLDVASVSDLTRGSFTAFTYMHDTARVYPGKIQVLDYNINGVIHTPSLHKTDMLCHAIGGKAWVCVSPTDTFNKYLKGCSIADILY